MAGEAGPLNLGVDCMRVFLSPSYSRPTRLGAPGRVRGQLAVSGALVALAKPSARGRHACLQTPACFDSLFFPVAHGSGGTPPRSAGGAWPGGGGPRAHSAAASRVLEV